MNDKHVKYAFLIDHPPKWATLTIKGRKLKARDNSHVRRRVKRGTGNCETGPIPEFFFAVYFRLERAWKSALNMRYYVFVCGVCARRLPMESLWRRRRTIVTRKQWARLCLIMFRNYVLLMLFVVFNLFGVEPLRGCGSQCCRSCGNWIDRCVYVKVIYTILGYCVFLSEYILFYYNIIFIWNVL